MNPKGFYLTLEASGCAGAAGASGPRPGEPAREFGAARGPAVPRRLGQEEFVINISHLLISEVKLFLGGESSSFFEGFFEGAGHVEGLLDVVVALAGEERCVSRGYLRSR